MVDRKIKQGVLGLNRPGWVAGTVVVAVLWLAALWAAQIDWASPLERNSVPLEWLARFDKLICMVGLIWLARRLQSRALAALATLMAALIVGGLLVNVDWYIRLQNRVVGPLVDFLPFSRRWSVMGALFLALALIAGVLVWWAWRHVRDFERPAVLRLLAILFVVGIFVGPVNAISALGINREWLFAEDFGQAVSLAVLAGYVVGLMVAIRDHSATLSRSS